MLWYGVEIANPWMQRFFFFIKAGWSNCLVDNILYLERNIPGSVPSIGATIFFTAEFGQCC